jgi:transposase
MMTQSTLFLLPEGKEKPEVVPTQRSQARLRRPVRQQVEWGPREFDALLPPEHRARDVWAMVERLSLDKFYASIKATVDGPGRPATDPQVLLALWVMATIDGVGSARELDRLCGEHDAYKWLRGGVPVNYHMLADFRVGQQAALDELLSTIVAMLMAADKLTLAQVAQDGMRMRASAGSASFREKEKLAACLQVARTRVAALKNQESAACGQSLSKRQEQARVRAGREREERIARALAYMPEMEAIKEQQRRLKGAARATVRSPRASTTDPDARIMRMADGGFRPAYNVQLATDVANGFIVGVSVSQSGADAGLASAMVTQVERRTGRRAEAWLVDGGYVSLPDITDLAHRGVAVYAPPPPRRSQQGEVSYEPRPGDTPEVVAWRRRMATAAGQEAYKLRARTAEWANAQARNHGARQFTVRGTAKVTSVMLLMAVALDLMRCISLGV